MPLDSLPIERAHVDISVNDEKGRIAVQAVPRGGVPLGESDHAFHARLRQAAFYVDACRETMSDEDRAQHLARLREIAAAPVAECGLRQLASFEAEFEHELKDYRDSYSYRATRKWAIFLGCAFAGTAALLLGNVSDWAPAFPLQVDGVFLGSLDVAGTLRWMFIWVWGSVGLSIGEMFSARYDSLNPRYQSFFCEARFRFNPTQRIVFVTLTWTIFMFLLAHGWLDMTIGGLTLSSVEDNPWSAVVLGIMTSIGFQGLIGTIVEKLRRKDK